MDGMTPMEVHGIHKPGGAMHFHLSCYQEWYLVFVVDLMLRVLVIGEAVMIGSKWSPCSVNIWCSQCLFPMSIPAQVPPRAS